MTDQQISRTNITEAALRPIRGLRITGSQIRAALDALGAPGDRAEAYIKVAAMAAADSLDALAAEPRSDAVTAPDEPGEHNEGTCDLCTGWHDAEEAAFMNGRREARAASASVPPLDEDALLFAVQATNDVLESRTASMAEKRDRLARAYRRYAAETPERGSSQRSDRKNLSTYQAETPEQGRGDE